MKLITLFVLIFLISGCATTMPDKIHGLAGLNGIGQNPWQNEPQIEVGQSNLIFDGLGNIISLPKKIILLDFKIDSHTFSSKTRQALERFIHYNPQMKYTKIRVNQFTPFGEFKRLIKNRKISWWWRIFPGIPTTIYSLAGRLLGGDHYNPYTDTVNIYSDLAPVVLHEAGHAVDTAQKVEEGWADYYTLGRMFPPIALYQEYEASHKAIDYLAEKEGRKAESNGYRVLSPAYGTYVGEYSGVPYGNIIGAGAGHILGIVPRYNNSIAIKALDGALWQKEVVHNIKSDLLSKSLIEEKENMDMRLNAAISKDNELVASIR